MPRERATSVRDDPDSAYRRGTVLGLTVAEIFILLLFLLMLVFLSLAQEWESEMEKKGTDTERELQEARSVLKDVRQVVEEAKDSIPVPDSPVTLVSGEEDENLTLDDALDNNESSLPKDVRELLDRASEAIQHERLNAEQAERRVEEAQAAAGRARRDLDVLRKKGHNPPCWYERVSVARGRDRERPYYTFEVAVFDDSMILRRVPVPPGGATDDEGSSYYSYAEEAHALELHRVPYNVPLSDEAVFSAIRPIHDLGKGGKVRSYSCIFWARVWDKTSSDAKERWKSAHDGILESLLGTYTVSEDPWED